MHCDRTKFIEINYANIDRALRNLLIVAIIQQVNYGITKQK